MADDSETGGPAGNAELSWFLRGGRAAISVPGFILVAAFVGFASLAREAGFTLAQTVFMTGIVWALPGKVVLIGAVMSGSTLPAAAVAVTLSSIRLMPMVVTLVPEVRTARTRKWVLYLLSHFIAVTSWVLAQERLPGVPRDMRTSFYGGLGASLVVLNMGVVAVVFLLAERLPPMVSAALFLLTPMYFLTSLWGSARERAGYAALALGLVLGPVFHILAPSYDLLAAGLLGGAGAYLFHRADERRRRRA